MPGSRISRPRWRFPAAARRLLPVLALTLGTAASLPWLVHPYYDATGDTAIYIRTAQAMLEGEGYAYMGEPFVLRPPGFSLLLLPVLHLRGTDFLALNLTVSLFGIACVVLFFGLLRPRTGALVATAAAAALWLNPAFRDLCNQAMSDVPGLALVLACLLAERRARRDPRMRWDLLVGVLVALAALVRSLSLLLIPAILLARWLRPGAGELASGGGRRAAARAGLVAALPLLVLIPWQLRNAALASSGPVEELRLHSYWVATWHRDRADPDSPLVSAAAVAARIPRRAAAIGAALGSRMQTDRLAPTSGLLALLALLGLACLGALLLRRRRPEAFLALGVLLVLCVYFGFSERLVLPVYLFALAATLEVGVAVLGRALSERGGRIAVACLVLILAAVDFAPRRRWASAAAQHRQLESLAAALEERFPPGSVFAATNGRHLSVFLGRPVHTLKFALARGGVERALEIIEERSADAVLTRAGSDLHRALESRHPIALRTPRQVVFAIQREEPAGSARLVSD